MYPDKKFTFTLGSLLVLLLGLASMGCGPSTTLAASDQQPIVTPTAPVFLPLVSSDSAENDAQLSAAVSQTESPLPTPGQTEWATYISDKYPFSVQYPDNWQVEVAIRREDSDVLSFKDPDCGLATMNCWISITVYDRFQYGLSPEAYAQFLNPALYPPNEGGYEAFDIRHLSTDSAEGVQFVWGQYRPDGGLTDFGKWGTNPSLTAQFYSEAQRLDVRLSAALDIETVELIEEVGFEEAINSQASIFEHMVSSLQIGEAVEE